jgi:hypothetical protein
MCLADDTPLYLPLKTGHGGFRSGDGQQRLCRDWDTLQRVADSHRSCHKNEEKKEDLERFKYCDDGSVHLSAVREYFVHGMKLGIQ